MDERRSVLVAYASAHGSTAGVAQRLATGLGAHGCLVEQRPVDRVEELGAYDAIVLGSAVYDGAWLPVAEEFVRRNLAALAARPAWLFSVAAFGDRKPVLGPLMRKEPKNVGHLRTAIQPRGYRVFAGAIERERWSGIGRLFFLALGGRFGDNRDWSEIDAWAAGIAQDLQTG